jgi:hypothetical protein
MTNNHSFLHQTESPLKPSDSGSRIGDGAIVQACGHDIVVDLDLEKPGSITT